MAETNIEQEEMLHAFGRIHFMLTQSLAASMVNLAAVINKGLERRRQTVQLIESLEWHFIGPAKIEHAEVSNAAIRTALQEGAKHFGMVAGNAKTFAELFGAHRNEVFEIKKVDVEFCSPPEMFREPKVIYPKPRNQKPHFNHQFRHTRKPVKYKRR